MLQLALTLALAAAVASAADPKIMADDNGNLLAMSKGSIKNISNMADMDILDSMVSDVRRRSTDNMVRCPSAEHLHARRCGVPATFCSGEVRGAGRGMRSTLTRGSFERVWCARPVPTMPS